LVVQTENPASALDAIVVAAAGAAPHWASSTADTRARLLRGLADCLEQSREALVALADQETGLGVLRLNGEVARTAFQLRGFAEQVVAGIAFSLVDDPAVAGLPPVGHPHLRRVRVPLGPVAMFAASNFPFAFSVLGGDTASALAAGCPVVVKAHPGHPRLSRLVHRLAVDVLRKQSLPEGLLGFVEGEIEAGVRLIRHPLIGAAAFTGSVRGGVALQAEANARPRPIPFFGELGSINPLVALPSALLRQGDALANTLAQSITNGSGQFCTSPGVIVVFGDESAQRFVACLTAALKEQKTHAMLTPAIRAGFDAGVQRLRSRPGVEVILAETAGPTEPPCPVIVRVSFRTFIDDEHLHEEVFGPAAIVVTVGSGEDVIAVLDAIGGSLTVTLWGADDPTDTNRLIVRAAVAVAGRVLFAGVPTGVAISPAQHHGGPWPSSTQPGTTSVGYAAIERFLRPVALQDAPDWILERNGCPV
jgi:acyl-CoA reductase-like NAD-dependent aldehyde dehydrogenase